MKKAKKILVSIHALFVLLALHVSGSLQGQSLILDWADGFGGVGIDNAFSHTTDELGNVYVTGSFADTVDFDPGPGTYFLEAVLFYDIYVAKFDNSGDLVWAFSCGGIGIEQGRGIVLDSEGNVFIAGYYQNSVDFNPGAPFDYLLSMGASDGFIAKYDNDGNFIWVKTVSGTTTEAVNKLRIDAEGNLYFAGIFNGTVDFDPGAGTNNLTAGGLTSLYVCKWDSLGTVEWVYSEGGVIDEAYDLVLTNSGEIYATGYYSADGDFEPGIGTTMVYGYGTKDIFVLKLDTAGNFIWARGMGGTKQDAGVSIVVDDLGYSYTTGWFEDTADFDPGVGVFEQIRALYNGYICKLSPDGNLVWAGTIGAESDDLGYGIAIDQNTDIYNVGTFRYDANFDFGTDTVELSALGLRDGYLAKYDSSGVLYWAIQIGGYDADEGFAVTVNDLFKIYVIGNFGGTSDFDPGAGITELTAVSPTDGFLCKYSQPVSDVNDLASGTAIRFWPNPTDQDLWVEVSGTSTPVTVDVFSASGQKIACETVAPNEPVCLKINGEPGFYFARMHNSDGNLGDFKFVKQ